MKHTGIIPNGPTVETRKWQWNEAFKTADGTWFCLLIKDPAGELIGFAKGQPYNNNEHPGFSGDLNKIYLLKKYQRLGLERRLLAAVADRFINKGIYSMLLFGEAQNPSNYFYEAMDAEKLFSKDGTFHGGYRWRDKRKTIPARLKKT